MGAKGPQLDAGLNIDFRLQRMLKVYVKADPPPDRVKPISIQVLRRIILVGHGVNDPLNEAITDMIGIEFFFSSTQANIRLFTQTLSHSSRQIFNSSEEMYA